MKIIFATQNQNKANEINNLMPKGIEVVSLMDLNYKDELEETSDTLSGNAEQKAKFIFEKFKLPCFADDTGLLVEALDDEPGVYSARYAGDERNDQANMNLVLRKLNGETNRAAKFKTVIAYCDASGTEFYSGEIKGEIIEEKRGKEGFGYDPIFMPENSELTFAEMSVNEKNEISHRSRAFKKFLSKFYNS